MRFRPLFIIAIIIALGGMGAFFLISPSYQTSFSAKLHYLVGDYELALEEAKKAYKEDQYNRMAATVMAHSMLALEYVSYIEDAKGYKKTIETISKKAYIERSDKLRIKFMAEIIIQRYAKLTPSVVIDKGLKDEAKRSYETFKQIHKKVLDSL